MRILWLSPWLRSLSRVQVEALARRGHDVLLVTSDQHPESDTARPYETVLAPHPKTVSTWPPFVRALPAVRSFGADVVVSELVRDPRWMLLAGDVPRVTVIHDDRPHDEAERRPDWEVRLFERWAAASVGTVAHSRYVADAIAGSAATSVSVVPLTSDLDEGLVLPPVDVRRDFVVPGRLAGYKNLGVVLAAWAGHAAGTSWRGDDLVLVGAGTLPPLPPHVRRVDGPYRYADVLDVLRSAKGSVAHYRRASQSGVQLLAMQLGVTPIVSDAGGLPEFQPPGEEPVPVDDVAGLVARFDALADPAAAVERGRRARRHYEQNFAADLAAASWEDVLTDARRRRPPTPRRAGRTTTPR